MIYFALSQNGNKVTDTAINIVADLLAKLNILHSYACSVAIIVHTTERCRRSCRHSRANCIVFSSERIALYYNDLDNYGFVSDPLTSFRITTLQAEKDEGIIVMFPAEASSIVVLRCLLFCADLIHCMVVSGKGVFDGT
jgi:hypothetical protein